MCRSARERVVGKTVPFSETAAPVQNDRLVIEVLPHFIEKILKNNTNGNQRKRRMGILPCAKRENVKRDA